MTAVSEVLSWLVELGFGVEPEKVLILSDSTCAIIQTRSCAAHFESRVAHKVARIQLAMEQANLDPYKNLGFFHQDLAQFSVDNLTQLPSSAKLSDLAKHEASLLPSWLYTDPALWSGWISTKLHLPKANKNLLASLGVSPQWAPHADAVLDQASGFFQDIPSGIDSIHLPGELENFLAIPSEISLHVAVIGQKFSSTFFNQLLEAKMNRGLYGRGSAARTLGVCLFFYRKLKVFRKLKPSIKQQAKNRWTQDFLALTNEKAPYCGHIFCHLDNPLCANPVHIQVPVVDTCIIENTIDGKVMSCSWRNLKDYQKTQARCSHYRCRGERLKLNHLAHIHRLWEDDDFEQDSTSNSPDVNNSSDDDSLSDSNTDSDTDSDNDKNKLKVPQQPPRSSDKVYNKHLLFNQITASSSYFDTQKLHFGPAALQTQLENELAPLVMLPWHSLAAVLSEQIVINLLAGIYSASSQQENLREFCPYSDNLGPNISVLYGLGQEQRSRRAYPGTTNKGRDFVLSSM